MIAEAEGFISEDENLDFTSISRADTLAKNIQLVPLAKEEVVVLNNNELGKITKEQRVGGWDKWATDLINPDFAAFAQSCGGLGIKVHKKEELESAYQQLFAHEGPALMEVVADVKLI